MSSSLRIERGRERQRYSRREALETAVSQPYHPISPSRPWSSHEGADGKDAKPQSKLSTVYQRSVNFREARRRSSQEFLLFVLL